MWDVIVVFLDKSMRSLLWDCCVNIVVEILTKNMNNDEVIIFQNK